MTEPTVAQPNSGAAPGAMEPGTMTDPATSTCGATRGASFLGEPFTDELFESIAHIVPEGGAIRVQRPGESYTQDYVANRLNVMLDDGGIIRDLRCG
ncbi:MAG: I78 family peptidase inhibitor [Pontixanthobacter sp.]